METDPLCNPGLLNIVNPQPFTTNGTTTTVSPVPVNNGRVLDVSSIVSLALWFLVILYTSFSSASKGDKLIQLGTGNKDQTDLDSDGRKSPLITQSYVLLLICQLSSFNHS
jgi:hypothetical protein